MKIEQIGIPSTPPAFVAGRSRPCLAWEVAGKAPGKTSRNVSFPRVLFPLWFQVLGEGLNPRVSEAVPGFQILRCQFQVLVVALRLGMFGVTFELDQL